MKKDYVAKGRSISDLKAHLAKFGLAESGDENKISPISSIDYLMGWLSLINDNHP